MNTTKTNQTKVEIMPWWKKNLYRFLLVVSFVVGAGIWEWKLPIILQIIISIASVIMIHFFWDELKGTKPEEQT